MAPILDEPPERSASILVDFIIDHLEAGDDSAIITHLKQLHSAEIAALLESLPPEQRQHLWDLLPPEVEGETLTNLSQRVRSSIIGEMEQSEIIAATDIKHVESLASVMGQLPDNVSEAVLESLDEDRRLRLEAILAFTEGTAGRLMSMDVISIRRNVTLAVVLRYLRYLKPLPTHTDSLMVIDEYGVFLGKLTLIDVVSENPNSLVADIIREKTDSISADTSEHEVAMLFERRDLVSVPVVDEQGLLLGRITIDHVIDIIRSEADKALLASAGLADDVDLFAPILPSAKRRAIWLGINLVTVFMAAWVIGRFEEALDKIVALAVLMPIVASMGGIAGSQTLTLTIRGLALGQVSKTNLRWLGSKELAVGFLNGCAWAIIVAIVTFAWFQDMGIALIIAVAMMLNLVAAAASGVLIPVILTRLNLDPALSGAVVLTTVTDIVGFLSFLGLATIFLL